MQVLKTESDIADDPQTSSEAPLLENDPETESASLAAARNFYSQYLLALVDKRTRFGTDPLAGKTLSDCVWLTASRVLGVYVLKHHRSGFLDDEPKITSTKLFLSRASLLAYMQNMESTHIGMGYVKIMGTAPMQREKYCRVAGLKTGVFSEEDIRVQDLVTSDMLLGDSPEIISLVKKKAPEAKKEVAPKIETVTIAPETARPAIVPKVIAAPQAPVITRPASPPRHEPTSIFASMFMRAAEGSTDAGEEYISYDNWTATPSLKWQL